MNTGMTKASFKNGERLEYTGDRVSSTIIDGKEVPSMFHGMIVTVIETKPPTKGIGFIKYDEDGEPLIDEDCDGYNVIVNQFGSRRLLWPKSKKEWRIIK